MTLPLLWAPALSAILTEQARAAVTLGYEVVTEWTSQMLDLQRAPRRGRRQGSITDGARRLSRTTVGEARALKPPLQKSRRQRLVVVAAAAAQREHGAAAQQEATPRLAEAVAVALRTSR